MGKCLEFVGGSVIDFNLGECVGNVLPVLFEQLRDGLWIGHAPNYMEVAVCAEEDLRNQVRPVIVSGVKNGMLTGELN